MEVSSLIQTQPHLIVSTCVRFGSNIAPWAETSRLGLSFTEWESVMEHLIHTAARIPWNKGKLVGQKAPLKLKDIWAIRMRLQIGHQGDRPIQPGHRQ